MKHAKLDLSSSERLFFVGDVHGQYDALQYALESLSFNAKDSLVSVGDVIDRGPKSLECLLFFKHVPNAHMVRGNHEAFFFKSVLEYDMRARVGWLWNGGEWSENYHEAILKGVAKDLEDIPHTLTITHDGKTFGVCHAQASADDWNDVITDVTPTSLDSLLWDRERYYEGDFTIKNVDYTIHGHMISPMPVTKGNQRWIDTGAQSIQNGLTRMTVLEWSDGSFKEHAFDYDTMAKQYRMIT